MKKDKVLFKKTMNIEIFDQDLPTKICDAINKKNLEINNEWFYNFDVRFSKIVYSNCDFFAYKLEKKNYEINKREEEASMPSIGDILGQILEKIAARIEKEGISLDGGSIIGVDDVKDNKVQFIFYRSKVKETETVKGKKNKKVMKAFSIIPDMEGIVNTFAEVFAKFIYEQNEKLVIENKKNPEKV